MAQPVTQPCGTSSGSQPGKHQETQHQHPWAGQCHCRMCCKGQPQGQGKGPQECLGEPGSSPGAAILGYLELTPTFISSHTHS